MPTPSQSLFSTPIQHFHQDDGFWSHHHEISSIWFVSWQSAPKRLSCATTKKTKCKTRHLVFDIQYTSTDKKTITYLLTYCKIVIAFRVALRQVWCQQGDVSKMLAPPPHSHAPTPGEFTSQVQYYRAHCFMNVVSNYWATNLKLVHITKHNNISNMKFI